MKSLDDLYALMEEVATLRRRIVGKLGLQSVDPSEPAELQRVHDEIAGWPQQNGRFVLQAGAAGEIRTGLDYELSELERDIVYLKDGEPALFQLLTQRHSGFEQEVEQLVNQLSDFFDHGLNVFVTDRDGTINNYCGRYRSSVQSVYNAHFLTRFARRCSQRSVILSSAPLQKGGLMDVSVNPEGTFVYAGSKGREFCDERGKHGAYPIDAQQQRVLDRFNARLETELDREQNRVFRLIGSSLQFKFGQTTVARQDVDDSVPDHLSRQFLDTVTRLVSQVDPEHRYLRIEDTGKDIEILLTVGDSAEARDFDKGDGIAFLDREVGLGLQGGRSLVCGDTGSDVPMARVAAQKSKHSMTVFVAADDELVATVRKVNSNACFVSQPDVLVTALNRLGGP